MRGKRVNPSQLRQIMLYEMGFCWVVSPHLLNDDEEIIYRITVSNLLTKGLYFNVEFESGVVLYCKTLKAFDTNFLENRVEQTRVDGYRYIRPGSIVYLKKIGNRTSIVPYRLEKRTMNSPEMQLNNLTQNEVIYPLPYGWEASSNLFLDYDTALLTDTTAANQILL